MKPPMNPEYILFGGTFVLANKLQLLGDKVVKGLTTKQWFLLANLIDLSKSETATVSKLAEVMDSSRQNTARMLESMEKEGLVTVKQSDSDKRTRIVSITAHGLTIAKESEISSQGFLSEVFDGISEEELRTASKVTLKMVENLERLKGYINES